MRARQVTTTTPIVVALLRGPVGTGLVASLGRPGGNVTGLTMTAGPEIGGKRLQLLKEAIPEMTHVAALWNVSVAPQHAREWHATEAAAAALGVSLLHVEGGTTGEFERAFSQIKNWRAHALLLPGDMATSRYRKHIIEFAAREHLPAMYGSREGVSDGGLMAYGVNLIDQYRRRHVRGQDSQRCQAR